MAAHVRRRAGASTTDEENPPRSPFLSRKSSSKKDAGNGNNTSEQEESKVHRNVAQRLDRLLACRWCCPRILLRTAHCRRRLWAVVLLQLLALLLVAWILLRQERRNTVGTKSSRTILLRGPPSKGKVVAYFDIVFPSSNTASIQFWLPLDRITAATLAADEFHGGLAIASLPTGALFRRVIPANDYEIAEQDRREILAEDSTRIIPYRYWYEEDLDSLHFPCRRPAWAKFQFLNCNAFHEISLNRDYSDAEKGSKTPNLQEYDNYLVNQGYYRDVWVNRKPADGTTTILKTTRFLLEFGWRSLFDVQREAVIMERLTAFPNIVSGYGQCGTSVLTEAVPHEVESYVVPGTGYNQQPLEHKQSQNQLSAAEKLQTALEMAESIAVLHGYQHGVVIHNDIQLQQWLRTSNDKGTSQLKLGDFNRATIPEWNVREKRYCKYSNGAAYGNVSVFVCLIDS